MSRVADATTFAALERAEGQLQSLQRTLRIAKAPGADPLRDYSLSRAIAWRAGLISEREAALEVFVDEEFRRNGATPNADRSVFIPPAVLLRAQSYQPLVTGYGPELIATDVRGDLFVDVLRNRMVCGQLGAQFIDGLKGDIQIPREETATVGYWLNASGSPVQSAAITESEATFDATPLKVAPCLIGGYGIMSRLLLQQSPLADRVIASDMIKVLATALDAAALQGAGSGGAPTGITATSGINTFSGASFSYSMSISALTDLTTVNAVVNRRTLGWTATPTVAGVLAQRAKATGYPSFIWEGNADTGSINGHPALATNSVPASTAVFGDFSQLLILRWGDEDAPVEVEMSRYGASQFATGDIQLRVMMSANVAVRHPQSFTVITGIT